MTEFKDYFLMEVENQSKVKNVEVREDNVLLGYEPETDLELKAPGRFSIEKLVGTLSGKAALHQFKKGDLVAVKLRHWGYKRDGHYVNHIYIEDIKLVKELDQLYL